MASNRETARDALVTLLDAALVGTGLPVKTVSGSKQKSLEGITPLVIVHSAGTERIGLTFQGASCTFMFVVQVWMLQTSTGWTPAQAADALDDIESIIAGVYEDNIKTSDWEWIGYDGPTSVDEIEVAGIPYYLEEIPTKVRLAKS